MPWIILRVEPAKEQKVCHNLQGIFETYCPLEYRHYRAGKGRARNGKEVVLIPKVVFIRREFVAGLQDIIGHRWVIAVARDAQGGVFVIPDCQMDLFKSHVEEWINNLKLQNNSAKNRKKTKSKWRPIDELKQLLGDTADEQLTY